MDYIIEFDYNADESDELTIKKGDIINNVKVHEDGWMIGVLRGKEGVFPSNFGKPLKEDKRKSQDEEILLENNNIDEQERPAKKVGGVGFGNIFSGGKIQLKQTSNHKDQKAKSYIDEPKPDPSIDKKPLKGKVELAKVLHNYNAENPDELTLEEGETITVLDKEHEDDGWWKGKLVNGQIGVFPENFVELIKTIPEELNPKPVRPSSTASVKGPPPVLAAKPHVVIAKTVPPRPPQLTEAKTIALKPTSRIANIEKDDGISFDSPVSHKPLVGPNAGRAKRPGKKLPSNVNVTSSNDDDKSNEIITPKSIVKDSPFYKEKSFDSSSRPKSKEIHNLEYTSDNSVSSKPKNTESNPIDKNMLADKISDIKSKSKENISTDNTQEIIPKSKTKDYTGSVERNLELSESKPIDKFKSHLTSDKCSRNLTDANDDISTLQLKVSNLQDENAELKLELSELRKSTTEQINQLKNKLNKFITEFDDEKSKRAATDVSLSRLKETVEDLEVAMLSRSNN